MTGIYLHSDRLHSQCATADHQRMHPCQPDRTSFELQVYPTTNHIPLHTQPLCMPLCGEDDSFLVHQGRVVREVLSKSFLRCGWRVWDTGSHLVAKRIGSCDTRPSCRRSHGRFKFRRSRPSSSTFPSCTATETSNKRRKFTVNLI